MSPTIRPLRSDDVTAYRGAPLRRTVRGFAAELDGRVVGIAGLSYDGAVLKAFSEFDPEMRGYRVTMLKAAKRVLGLIGGCRPLAVVDGGDVRAARFARHLGFELLARHSRGDIYRWTR